MMSTCQSCKFFLFQSEEEGICRRYPPTVLLYTTDTAGTAVFQFPSMFHDGWCGEHKEEVKE